MAVEVSVDCESNPEKVTIKNNRAKPIVVQRVGSTYRERAGEPFELKRKLKPGKKVTYTFGTGKGKWLSRSYILDNEADDEGVTVRTSKDTVLLLDTRNRVIARERHYQADVSAAQVRVVELFREAVHQHVPRIILVHNHPSGGPTPSPDDLHRTAGAVAAGRLPDMPLLDHIVVGGEGFVSLRDSGVAFRR